MDKKSAWQRRVALLSTLARSNIYPTNMKNIKSLAQLCLAVFAALILAAYTTNAQTDSSASTNSATVPTPPPAKKGPKGKRYTGKVTAVDTTAMTITWTTAKGVSQTMQISSKTKIKKDGDPATLEDVAVGMRISGGEHQDESSNWIANTVIVGERKAATTAPAPVSPQ
jgi:hypothetical protein